MPLEWRGRIIGACIVFSRDDRRAFGPADAELLQLFARHAAIALANARMHEAAEERARSEAVAAERDRLLAEVHDTLAQRLVSVRVHIDSAGETSRPGRRPRRAPGAVRAEAAGRICGRPARAARDALVEARLTLLGLAAVAAGRPDAGGRAPRRRSPGRRAPARLEVRFVSAGTPVALDGGCPVRCCGSPGRR